MDIWLAFAYISEGIVQNVACYLYTGYTEANEHARVFCDDAEAIAVDVTHTPVQIGDTYENGFFYRDGKWIEPIPSVAEQTNINTNDIEDTDNLILDHEERLILLEVGE